jgi:hypothetical protein
VALFPNLGNCFYCLRRFSFYFEHAIKHGLSAVPLAPRVVSKVRHLLQSIFFESPHRRWQRRAADTCVDAAGWWAVHGSRWACCGQRGCRAHGAAYQAGGTSAQVTTGYMLPLDHMLLLDTCYH